MKKQYRFLSVLLIAALLAAVPAAVQAEYDAGVSVYIPNKIERLHLPDMPEYIALFTRTQSIATYGNPKDPTDPCPILPVSEPDIELFFSEQPEWAAVLWSEGIEYINVNEAGYARVSSAGHKLQPGIVSGTMVVKDENGKEKRVWAATTADHTAGDPVPQEMLDGAYMASKDGVTVLYSRNGTPVWVEYSIPDDFYKTGIDGAVTTVRYERVVISGDRYIFKKDENGQTVKHNLKGNVVIFTLENGETYYIDTYDYTNITFEDEIFEGKITYTDNKVQIEIFTEDGISIGYVQTEERDAEGHIIKDEDGKPVMRDYFTREEFANMTKENHLDLSHYKNAVPGKDSYVHFYYTTWYISQVVTTYPDDINYIVRVESDWKNNSGQFLWGYKITYATSAKERYKITYMPYTTTILEDHGTNKFYEWDNPTYPSTDLEAYFEAIKQKQIEETGSSTINPADYHGMYLHHYEEDTPIYGEYTDGTLELVSGSGDFLNYWYEKGHGARVYKYLYPCTYFSTPRYR